MLSEKPWKLDALVRLLASVAICIFSGSILVSVLGYLTAPHKPHAALFFAANAAAFGALLLALFVLGRPWPFEKYLENLAVLLGSVYGGFFLMWWAARLGGRPGELENTTVKTVVAVLSFQGAALVLVHRFLREHHTGWAEAFGFRNNLKRTLLLGSLAGLLFLPAWVLQFLSGAVMEHMHMQPQEQETVQILQATEAWTNRLVIGVAAVVIAPVAEEILFRGILYPAIKQRGHPRLALWSTALLFGAIHLNAATFLPLTFLAVVLVGLYEYTGNLLACILAHGLFNAANFIALFLLQS